MRYDWKAWKWFAPNKKWKKLTQTIQSRKLKNEDGNKNRERRIHARTIIDCQTISNAKWETGKREWKV